MDTRHYSYQFDLTEALQEAQIDRAAGIIRNVQIARDKSKNGRTYTTEALAGIASLAPNLPVFLNHGTIAEYDAMDGVRDVRNLAAKIDNAQVSGNRVVGDLRVSPDLAERLFWVAENKPFGVGLSLVSPKGGYKMRKTNTDSIIEEITMLESIDIVSKAGMSSSLFEQIEDQDASGTEAANSKAKDKDTMELEEMQKKIGVLESEKEALIKECNALKAQSETLNEKTNRRAALLKELAEKSKTKAVSIEQLETLDALSEVEDGPRERLVKGFLESLTEQKTETAGKEITLTEKNNDDSKAKIDADFARLGL